MTNIGVDSDAANTAAQVTPRPVERKENMMPPEIPNPDDPITPRIVKWIVLPILAAVLISMAFDLQINQWKCSREAKRQGYLESEYYPAYRFTPASCVCRKKIRPDGTVDNYAKMVIDLQNKKLNW